MSATLQGSSKEQLEQRQRAIMHEFNEKGREFVARYPCKCELCGESVLPGSTILWMSKRAIHKHCPEPIDHTEVTNQVNEVAMNVVFHSDPVADGIYTVMFENDEYRTIKIETAGEQSPLQGRRIVSYLSGPDNTRDYTGFAFLERDNEVKVWRRFREHADSLIIAAGRAIADPQHAGELYAQKSGRCCKCNRVLTVPASLHRGMGPKCAAGSQDD